MTKIEIKFISFHSKYLSPYFNCEEELGELPKSSRGPENDKCSALRNHSIKFSSQWSYEDS